MELRPAEQPHVEPGQNVAPSVSPAGLVLIATWQGLATGLIEVGILTLWLQFDGSAILGSLQLSRHFAWMIPLSHLVIFVLISLPALVLGFFRPRLALRITVFAGSFLAYFSLLSMIKGMFSWACALLALGLAYQTTQITLAHISGFRRMVRWTLPALFGLFALCGYLAFDRVILHERRNLAALPAAPANAPNVLFIVLDTVPANRMSLHGYARDTTPNLKRLAARGVKFNEARSPAPWTLPSHASMFTGRWPHELGLEDGRTLDSRWPTLAEFMTKRGYATSGFVGNTYFCNSWYGLARGFLHYEDYYEENVLISPEEALKCTALGRWVIKLVGSSYLSRPESVHFPKDATRVKRDFTRWLDANPTRPFFTFLNYIDAHDPYQPPLDREKHFGLKIESAEDFELIRSWHLLNKSKLTPRELTLVNDAYDDCLAHIDEQIGVLIDDLDRRGRLENTYVVITADHGEQFGDRNLWGHGGSLYRPEMHVPLIVFGPGIPAGKEVAAPISLRDISTTLLELVGASGKPSPFPGRSLVRHWTSDGPITPDTVLCGVDATIKIASTAVWPPSKRGPMASVIVDGYNYIRDALGGEELYRVEGDPTERQNLIASPDVKDVIDRCRAEFKRIYPAGRQK